MSEEAKISWVSPLPPQLSGVAQYAREVLPLLRRHYRVDSLDDPSMTERDEAEALDSDLLLCHVGNNSSFHEHAVRLAGKRPCLLVLHDVCCHHLLADLTLGKGRVKEYARLCRESDGDKGGEVAEIHAAFGFQEELGFRILCSKSLVESSLGVLVHSEWAERTLRAMCPLAQIQRIPFIVIGRDLVEDTSMEEPSTPTILLPGYVTRPKLPFHLLTAVSRLRKRGRRPRLVLGGNCEFQGELESAAEALGITEQVLFTGSLSEREYHETMSQATVCVCLRDPSAGESSATLWQAMAHGKACVAVDHAAYAELPEGVVAKVSPGPPLLDELEAVLDRLLSERGLRRALGEEARRTVDEEHGHRAVEEGYVRAVKSFLAAGQG